MDAQQDPHVSPDGRYRWDAAAQRWVPVEQPLPPVEQPPAANAEQTIVGGWGRPVQPMHARSGSTFPRWPAQQPPGAPPPQTRWTAPPATPWEPAGPPTSAALVTPTGVAAAVAVVGGIVLVLGAFLAWISASAQGISTSQSGINTPSGDGWFFVVCGLLIAAAAVGSVVAAKPWLGFLVVSAALACAGLTIYEFTDVHGHIADARTVLGPNVGSYGAGLFFLAVGSALAFAGGVGEALRAR